MRNGGGVSADADSGASGRASSSAAAGRRGEPESESSAASSGRSGLRNPLGAGPGAGPAGLSTSHPLLRTEPASASLRAAAAAGSLPGPCELRRCYGARAPAPGFASLPSGLKRHLDDAGAARRVPLAVAPLNHVEWKARAGHTFNTLEGVRSARKPCMH